MGRGRTAELLYGSPEQWYVADFETLTTNTDYFEKNQDTTVILANSFNWKNETHFTFNTINEWWDFHASQYTSQSIWFHNLTWDGDFLIKFLTKKGITPRGINDSKKWNIIDPFLVGGKIYKMHVWLRKKVNGVDKKYCIVFRCSLRLLNSPVSVLGKSVGLNKHHPDDDNVIIDENGRKRAFYDWEPMSKLDDWFIDERRQRFVEYIKNDCEIVYRSLKEFSQSVIDIPFVKRRDEEVLRNGDGKPFQPLESMTSAALTQKLMTMSVKEYVFKNNMKGIYPLKINRETHQFIGSHGKGFFRGGFTQLNDKFNNGESERITDISPSMFIDVSSAYPYQMTFPLPYGEILNEKPSGVEGKDYYTFITINVKLAKIKKEYYECPILVNWNKINKNKGSDERYVREMKNFKCWYISDEWDIINEFYDVVVDSSYECYMKAAPFLKDYSEELYKIKNHYSETKQEGLKQGAKILINASYGSTAKRIDYGSKIIVPSEDKEFFDKMERDDLFVMDGREFRYNFYKPFDPEGNLIVVDCESTKEKQSAPNKAAASVITSRERIYLWKLIKEVGCNHFCYSDTDSILFGNLKNDKLDYLTKLTSHDKVKLGDWEKEYPNKNINYFATHGAKRYMLLDENKELIKWRFAGVKLTSTRAKEVSQYIDFNEDEIEFEDAVLLNQSTPSGRVLISKPKIIRKGKI